MTRAGSLPELALLTLKDPKAAGTIVVNWRLSREALWTAIALVGVIATILSTFSNMVLPLPEPFEALGQSPLLYLLIAVGGFVGTVLAIYWTGMLLGGQGNLHDLMTLLMWLQGLRAAAQALILVALFVAPTLGSFFALFVGVATFWIFVNFIAVGLHLDSLWRATAVLILGAITFIVGLSFLLSLFGVTAVGVPF